MEVTMGGERDRRNYKSFVLNKIKRGLGDIPQESPAAGLELSFNDPRFIHIGFDNKGAWLMKSIDSRDDINLGEVDDETLRVIDSINARMNENKECGDLLKQLPANIAKHI